jgi:hypothetical protein
MLAGYLLLSAVGVVRDESVLAIRAVALSASAVMLFWSRALREADWRGRC